MTQQQLIKANEVRREINSLESQIYSLRQNIAIVNMGLKKTKIQNANNQGFEIWLNKNVIIDILVGEISVLNHKIVELELEFKNI